VVTGALAWFAQAPGAGTAPGDSPAVPGPAAGPASPGRAAPPEAVRARWVPGAPRRVLVPRLDVDAAVRPVKAPGGTLVPPSDPQQLGWWAAGARPGDRTGSALVTGHTVHTGGGALDNLETLRRGDRVTVRTDRGRIRYAVRSVAVYAKGALAKQAERLFSQEVPGRLVLITCEDWDGSRYLSNVVVTASPAP
jgi:LPXTG-site transpeptidase (sortase) family protein